MTNELKKAIETVKEYLDMDSDVDSEYLNAQRTIINALETQPTDAEREAYIKGYDYGVKDWFKSKTQPCEDCISRQAAIDFIIDNYGLKCSSLTNGIRDYLPPVVPQRPKGKWIEIFVETPNDPYRYGFKAHKCSKCEYRPFQISNYCPNCGAEMSGGGEDEDSD